MKEDYFTENFLLELKGKYFRASKWTKIKPFKRAAVLAIDLQRYFLDERSKAYLPSTGRFIQHLKAFYESVDIPIIFTRHHHAGDMMEFWWGDKMEKNELFEIVDELKPFARRIVDKRTYNAFYNTTLEALLKEFNIETVIITGVMTHLCCETTAREAFVRGFKVVFPIDGTLTQNRAFHEGTIRALAHGFAATPLLEEVKEWLSSE
ncbi:hypothetical protein PAP_03725 [Palaeococcus pacificus DY20341]|uniref:Isochorismatase-like domain-containing protein n=1 Tax=Palaeococcus pacificus DY20341 TaxID=1343739 RepID=A0A075LSA4_9EURY|nr:isochorismatase family protein [Palaeococcus pacificus]AIF69164.1 hypothetical protein PAP_03725 [Palaeococcus pacificus DY20341]